MDYISTRAAEDAPEIAVPFATVLAEGLGRDGGLFVPEYFPAFSEDEWKQLAALPYQTLAATVMARFMDNALPYAALHQLVATAYAGFSHKEITPLRRVDCQTHLLELFHGPTLAFKDVALQCLGQLFGHYRKEGEPRTILGATSGDTGSAALAGCARVPGIDAVILYPHQRPSVVQRRQMTTLQAKNVKVLAVEGSFDDCQLLVKQAFYDQPVRRQHRLTAVNSINWARIMAQVVYYIYAGLRAGALKAPVNFVVPTGNFGNAYAGYVAKQMGLAIDKIVIATNHNDSLSRFVRTGVMQPGITQPSLSPSMDIQLPSNVERYWFDLLQRDSAALAQMLQTLQQTGQTTLPAAAREAMHTLFLAGSASDGQTLAAMQEAWQNHQLLLDPHTGVAAHVARHLQRTGTLQGQTIILACAHPSKFPETVRHATGQPAPLPPALADLHEREEHFTVIPPDYAALLGQLADR